MPKLFADLHVHPTLYQFNRMRNDPSFEGDPDRFHPWHVLPSNVKHLAQGERGATYTQASIPKLVAGRCRLAFASITPIEKGFFDGRLAAGSKPFALELLKWVTGAVPVIGAAKWAMADKDGALREFAGILRNRGPLRQFVQSVFLKYHRKRVLHLMSEEFDYWDEFLREYDFMVRRNGVVSGTSFELPSDDGPVARQVEGAYHLISDPGQLESIIGGGERDVALVLSIEGAHTLSIGPDQERVDEAVLFERIDALKALPHPILFITLAHHFDNGLCGHARSIPDAAKLVMDQTARMNLGLERENDLGGRVVRGFLGLDDALQDTGQGRILIDCKHMSARARQEYYAEVIGPYNASAEGPAPQIPVIFSHAAYSGVRTLDEQVADLEHEGDGWLVRDYYGWNLNICDDDVRQVFASQGLIGLVFDQRVLGRRPGVKLADRELKHLLFRHLFAVVDVIWQDDRIAAEDRPRVWDCVCLGTDYDGMIDPVAPYATVLSLDDLADDLRTVLVAEQHTRGIAEIGVDELIEKIAWRNAYDLALRHLPWAKPSA